MSGNVRAALDCQRLDCEFVWTLNPDHPLTAVESALRQYAGLLCPPPVLLRFANSLKARVPASLEGCIICCQPLVRPSTQIVLSRTPQGNQHDPPLKRVGVNFQDLRDNTQHMGYTTKRILLPNRNKKVHKRTVVSHFSRGLGGGP